MLLLAPKAATNEAFCSLYIGLYICERTLNKCYQTAPNDAIVSSHSLEISISQYWDLNSWGGVKFVDWADYREALCRSFRDLIVLDGRTTAAHRRSLLPLCQRRPIAGPTAHCERMATDL